MKRLLAAAAAAAAIALIPGVARANLVPVSGLVAAGDADTWGTPPCDPGFAARPGSSPCARARACPPALPVHVTPLPPAALMGLFIFAGLGFAAWVRMRRRRAQARKDFAPDPQSPRR